MGPKVFKTLTGEDMLDAPTDDDGSVLVELDMKFTLEQWRSIEDRYRKQFSMEHNGLAPIYTIHLTHFSFVFVNKILLFLSKWFDFGKECIAKFLVGYKKAFVICLQAGTKVQEVGFVGRPCQIHPRGGLVKLYRTPYKIHLVSLSWYVFLVISVSFIRDFFQPQCDLVTR